MTRDNRDRLSLFAGTPVTVVRLALNMSQIEQYKPPPNPLKMKTNAAGEEEHSDSRAAAYVREFGEESWELDALSPTTIHNLIHNAIIKVRDEKLWAEALAEEAEDKNQLDKLIEDQS